MSVQRNPTDTPRHHNGGTRRSPRRARLRRESGLRPDGTPRLVITGVGAVSPVGIGNDDFFAGLCDGLGGVDASNACETRDTGGSFCPNGRLVASVREFSADRHLAGSRKHFKTMSRDVQLGVLAADLATDEARITRGTIDPDRLGVVFAAGRISPEPQTLAAAAAACVGADGKFDPARFGTDGLAGIAPLWLLRQLPNMPACHISIALDARGPNNTVTSRDAGCILTLDEAARTIARGAADAVVVGAASSSTDAVDLARMAAAGELTGTRDPQHALRPFDAGRDGTVPGEGAAAFVLERWDHAVRRGAEIYGELLGTAAAHDGRDRTGGGGLVNAMKAALRKGGLDHLRGVGHLNAHGKSTRWDDLVESRALRTLFGDDLAGVPVTALKSHFGYTDAGSGALELAGSVLALRHRRLPMTLGFETPDPLCGIDVIHDGPLDLVGRTALSVNRTSAGEGVAALIQAV